MNVALVGPFAEAKYSKRPYTYERKYTYELENSGAWYEYYTTAVFWTGILCNGGAAVRSGYLKGVQHSVREFVNEPLDWFPINQIADALIVRPIHVTEAEAIIKSVWD